MKWFDRWFYRKAKWAWENRDEIEADVPSSITRASRGNRLVAVEEDVSWGDGLRIQVHRVHGGHVVTFRHYDRKTDRNNDQHYIINADSDFNQELGKLITMESMRHN